MATSYTRLMIAKEILITMLNNDEFRQKFEKDRYMSAAEAAASEAVRYADALITKVTKDRNKLVASIEAVESNTRKSIGAQRLQSKLNADLGLR